ncbi:hypothetical protein TNCV_2686111 [Trichonephila clavipes]|nr:hypothetical protein TNCV_2686111 [Trichonephila clavipes]
MTTSLTATLYGIVEDSCRQPCGRWRSMEGFVNINPAGSHHLWSNSRETILPSVEDLITRIFVAAGRIRNKPKIFQKAKTFG